jgi:amino acid transporter
LVFTNGIVFLAIATGILIVLFSGNSHLLIPLFAIGAFLAFTLSQSGMVVHWIREKSKNWRLKAFLNGLGAITTATTLVIITISKFHEGAWITVLLIPIFSASTSTTRMWASSSVYADFHRISNPPHPCGW